MKVGLEFLSSMQDIGDTPVFNVDIGTDDEKTTIFDIKNYGGVFNRQSGWVEMT